MSPVVLVSFFVFAILLVPVGSTAALNQEKEHVEHVPPRVEKLKWLAGSWGGVEAGSETEEHWIEPKGGVMLGVNRTTRGDKATFEFIRLQETKGTVILYASPGGRTAVPFELKSIGENRVVFENLKNDFPHRIFYHRKGGKLHAAIEGEIQGKMQQLKWSWDLQTKGLQTKE